ncbi:hypothetical protein IHE45_12G002000 [Dioscorea alata]|uniref:Uncharacterized protein n=1 Tax=Dioscorea alata TaxID=55571 RepID=A0ACB7V042_DIOAL|nr:hypothetical protein IHE45_12G002000 [Dioscorea alata]
MENVLDERFRLNHSWSNDYRRSHPYLTILFVSSMATLISSTPLALWKRATPSRPPARRRNPPPFLRCKLNSQVHAPVLGSERLDHLGLLSHSSVSPPVRAPELLPGPELGLLSVLFVLTAVVGSFFTLTIISFPAKNAFRRLKVSSEKLSKVVSEEVPATLSSLRLSVMEINDLTSELSNLRNILSGRQHRTKERTNRQSSRGGRRIHN